MIVNLAIPFALSRMLSVDAYGSYKQITELVATMVFFLELGSDASFYYFVGQKPKRHHFYSTLVSLFSLLVGLTVLGLMGLFADAIKDQLSNDAYLQVWLPAGLFMTATLATRHLSGHLIYCNRLRLLIGMESSLAFGKTGIIIAGFAYGGDGGLELVLWGLAGLYGVLLTLLSMVNIRGLLQDPEGIGGLRQDIRAMIRYSLPVGLKNIAGYVNDMHQLMVSIAFGLKAMAFYSAGCIRLPVLTYFSSTFITYASIPMLQAWKEQNRHEFCDLYRQTLRKIMLVQVPLVLFIVFFADPIIRLLFSDRYTPAIIILQICYLGRLMQNDVPDMLYYATGKTKELFMIELAALPVFLGLIFWSLNVDMRITIAVVSFMAWLQAAAKFTWLSRKEHLKLQDLLPLSATLKTIFWSLAAIALTQLCLYSFDLRPFFQLSAALPLYSAMLFAMIWAGGLLEAEEKKYFHGHFTRIISHIRPS